MADYKYNFETNQAATQLTNITTEQYFDAIVLDNYAGVHVQIEVNFPGSPTDDAIIAVYTRVDGTNWDVVPLFEQTIDNGDDPSRVSFHLSGYYEFRVGIRRSGTTDTITSADQDSRRYTYDDA
jgi:hypothetical protein